MEHRPGLQAVVVHLARVDRLADLRLDLLREAGRAGNFIVRPMGKAGKVRSRAIRKRSF
jgi:hypothetical protein